MQPCRLCLMSGFHIKRECFLLVFVYSTLRKRDVMQVKDQRLSVLLHRLEEILYRISTKLF